MLTLDPVQGAFVISNTKRSFYKTFRGTDPENSIWYRTLGFSSCPETS